MNVIYDNEVDALYIRLGDDAPEGVTGISNGINVDLTPEGKIVGIEILDAAKKLNLRTILQYNLEFEQQPFLQNAA